MKYLALVFLAVALFEVQAYTESDLDATDRYCLEKLAMDKSVVINSYDESDLIKEGNADMYRFYDCAWVKDGLSNADGSINFEALHPYVVAVGKKYYPGKDNEYLATEAIKGCKDLHGSNNGELYVRMYNCMYAKILTLV